MKSVEAKILIRVMFIAGCLVAILYSPWQLSSILHKQNMSQDVSKVYDYIHAKSNRAAIMYKNISTNQMYIYDYTKIINKQKQVNAFIYRDFSQAYYK